MSPRVFLAGMLVALGAAALVIVAMLLLGEHTKTRGRLLLTALTLAGFCLSALAPSALHRRRRHRPLARAGMLASLAAFILVATGIWATPNPDAYWKAVAIASIMAVSMFHVSLLLLQEPGRPLAGSLLWAAVAATLLAALLASLGIAVEVKAASYWWAVFLIVVTALAGSLAAPALNRWGPAPASRRPSGPGGPGSAPAGNGNYSSPP
jgi:hypothetical protein